MDTKYYEYANHAYKVGSRPISSSKSPSDRPNQANTRTNTHSQQPPATVPVHAHHGGSEEPSTDAGKPNDIE